VPSSATETSVVLVVAAVAAAPILADSLQRWIAVPNVVVELMLGILIGPAALSLVTDTPVIAGIADFGLAMLMFLAGYEIDFHEISGTPLRLALSGWPISLVLGLAAGTVIRGVSLDVTALVHQPSALAFIPVFLLLFLLVRGGPVPFLYRNVATRGQVAALALLSATALPLVVVITTIGTQAGVIRASTAAALVCAGMISVLILPLTALKILRREAAQGTSPGSGDSSEPPGSYASEEKRTQVDSRRAPGHSRRPLESSLPAPT